MYSVLHTHNAALCEGLRNVRVSWAVGEHGAMGVGGGRVRKGKRMEGGDEACGTTVRLQGCVG